MFTVVSDVVTILKDSFRTAQGLRVLGSLSKLYQQAMYPKNILEYDASASNSAGVGGGSRSIYDFNWFSLSWSTISKLFLFFAFGTKMKFKKGKSVRFTVNRSRPYSRKSIT